MKKCYFLALLPTLVLTALLYTKAANATPAPAYQVELIVYSHLTASALASERWPMVERVNIDTPTPYPLLPRQNFRMISEEVHLKRAPGYQVLLHVAWQQPTSGPTRSLPTHIYGGALYNEQGIEQALFPNGGSPYAPGQIWQVDGTFQMNVQHFLETKMNFILAAPTRLLRHISSDYTFEKPVGDVAFFKLNDSRNMRSNELNYLSHPLFGVLIKVYPLNNA